MRPAYKTVLCALLAALGVAVMTAQFITKPEM